ncbi:helix-turn-helix domain-containing protein [Aquipuribacter nitratireducens]|uniref:Helix-turn-helix domain-containing protein n=1 Tax=Aquipuribacter nitratireducens TaxID=650104 RepID=A0ABW0GMY0_9MICO
MVLLREEIGDVLRGARQRQGRTLRDVSSSARVSLGYLSEVERGQKEASSELLLSICEALDVPMSSVLRSVSDRVAVSESLAARLEAGAGVPATQGARTARTGEPAVDAIRKTVIPAPVASDDESLAPVA